MGCSRMRLSSKPFAVAAIAPGRYRGCGRNPLACIHTQREPSFSPLGTATNTANPGRVSSNLTTCARRQETLHGERKYRIRGKASGAIHGRVAFLPRCRSISRCARFSRRPVRRDSRTDAGWKHVIIEDVTGLFRCRVTQDAWRLLLRLRGVVRLRLPLSIGSEPLQSG